MFYALWFHGYKDNVLRGYQITHHLNVLCVLSTIQAVKLKDYFLKMCELFVVRSYAITK